jgi:IMP dehydrogenase/GMP reductase
MNKYTFNDVLIEPRYSEIESRSSVDLTTDMGIFKLQLPIISANMKGK